MNKLLTLSISILLSGCVVAPAYRVQPVPVYRVQPVPVEEQIEYPQYESAYIWDPVILSFFFIVGGHRHYMDRGWHPRYGYPHGYYRHH